MGLDCRMCHGPVQSVWSKSVNCVFFLCFACLKEFRRIFALIFCCDDRFSLVHFAFGARHTFPARRNCVACELQPQRGGAIRQFPPPHSLPPSAPPPAARLSPPPTHPTMSAQPTWSAVQLFEPSPTAMPIIDAGPGGSLPSGGRAPFAAADPACARGFGRKR